MQTGLTGRRTKAVARKSTALRGSSFSIVEPIKKEEDSVEDCPESSSSPESRNKVAQTKKQVKEARSFDSLGLCDKLQIGFIELSLLGNDIFAIL